MMNNLAKEVKYFLVSEDGPTAVEYAIMLGLIGIFVMTGAGALGTAVNMTFTTLASTVNGWNTGGS